MSKITFRADDDLVERLEACDASKSEVMREALRTHLDEIDDDAAGSDASVSSDATVDAVLADRVDDLIADRLDAALDDRFGGRPVPSENASRAGGADEITVNVTLDAPSAAGDDALTAAGDDARVTREGATDDDGDTRKTRSEQHVQTRESRCSGCGESVPATHVYCPNCGEKRSHRAFCECGDELRTDWAFCPGCGRRTPAADVLNDK
ncbi:MAG: double zinc ribbon domain-containing protein [Halorubrum sp.]